MKVSNQMIARSVLSELKAGKSSGVVVSSLAAYLVVQRRTKDADAIMREVERQLQKLENQVELRITTAHGLDESLKTEITRQFTEPGQRVIINEIKDPSVVGGVLVESNGKRLDLTIRRQLQRLKEMGV